MKQKAFSKIGFLLLILWGVMGCNTADDEKYDLKDFSYLSLDVGDKNYFLKNLSLDKTASTDKFWKYRLTVNDELKTDQYIFEFYFLRDKNSEIIIGQNPGVYAQISASYGEDENIDDYAIQAKITQINPLVPLDVTFGWNEIGSIAESRIKSMGYLVTGEFRFEFYNSTGYPVLVKGKYQINLD